ncbi:MAG: response regulator [Candidatus Thermoplasmatota archaeon]|jgi:PAS domain S-box-containing protein|nr:response regulator [Candidatus Thermoplasmatota archaeon]
MNPYESPERGGDILFITDEDDIFSDLDKLLRGAGHTVRWAKNMKILMKTLNHLPPELIIININLPSSDGFEVCWFLKKNQRTREIPIIFVNMKNGDKDKVKGFKAGGADYFDLPYIEEEVLARVHTHLKLSRLVAASKDLDTEACKAANASTIQTMEFSKRLKESDERYRTVINSLSDAIHVVDTDLEIVLMNDSCAKMNDFLGVEKDCIGKTLPDVYHFYTSKIIEEYDWVLRTGKVLVTEQRLTTMDEKLVTEVRKVPVFSDNKVSHIITVIRDVTEVKEAQESLVSDHQQLMEIINLLPEPTFVIDREMSIIAWNKAMEELTGSRRLDVVGKDGSTLDVPFFDVARSCLIDKGDETAQEWESSGHRVERTGKYHFSEGLVQNLRDGKSAQLWVVASPLLNKNGECYGAIETMRDVTERVNNERELKRHREELEVLVKDRTSDLEQARKIAMSLMQDANMERVQTEKAMVELERTSREVQTLRHKIDEILKTTKTGMNIIDRDLNLTYVNSGFIDLYGEVSGRKCYDYFYKKAGPCENCYIDVVLDTKTANVHERKLKGEDGAIVQVTSIPLQDESGKWVVAQLSVDITERKKIEYQLKKAMESVEAAAVAKSEFLANMSHEIRTPINAIKGMTELVLDSELETEQRKYLTLAKESIEALMIVINDILDFSKIEAGKLEIEFTEFDIREMISSVIGTMSFKAAEKDIVLKLELDKRTPERLMGDPMRLRQVLINLIGNSIKFTQRGSITIRTEMQGGRVKDNRTLITFSVADTGIGIAKEKLEKIFESFTQADSSITRKYGGTGLGLSISQKLVGLMGGRIWVESELGEGSTFHFTTELGIPLPKAGGDEGHIKDLEGLSILVVDDNKVNRAIFKGVFQRLGVVLTNAGNGKEVLSMMADGRDGGFDLLIIDQGLPDMTGTELISKLRSIENAADLPLILMTSDTASFDRRKLKKVGITGLLPKPVNVNELLDLVRSEIGEVKKRTSKDPGPDAAPGTGNRPLAILLVEDHIINQKLAKALLEKRNHNVTIANNGKEAVSVLEREDFDLVLMDLQMPEMDGLEATRRIRDKGSGVMRHDIPIIAMTAHAMSGDRDKCLVSGMDGYISKPINVNELFDEIGRICRTANAKARA